WLEWPVRRRAGRQARRGLGPKWAQLVYDGLWFSPLRAAYDAFFTQTQSLVTGQVRLALQSGTAVATGRRSEFALYAEELASYGTGETFPHEAAEGFIRISALETELAAARERRLAGVGRAGRHASRPASTRRAAGSPAPRPTTCV